MGLLGKKNNVMADRELEWKRPRNYSGDHGMCSCCFCESLFSIEKSVFSSLFLLGSIGRITG